MLNPAAYCIYQQTGGSEHRPYRHPCSFRVRAPSGVHVRPPFPRSIPGVATLHALELRASIEVLLRARDPRKTGERCFSLEYLRTRPPHRLGGVNKREARYSSPRSPHHRTSMMMDHQPFITDPLEQIGGEHTGFDWSFALPAGQVFRADHPP